MPSEALRLEGPLLQYDPDGRALARARSLGRDGALAELERSGLRGRGGAYFPTARKWRAALDQRRPLALVVNAEEGEPGVFKDRAILGLRPPTFVEGLAIASLVVEPELTVIFINGEARAARRSLEDALGAALGLLPIPRILPGGGGYVLGEESTMLNAIEGRKPVPRLRPPYPVESGLFGMPTVINNVETIAVLALVFGEGAEPFAATGHPDAPGTRLVSLSGRVQRPGIYEVPTGTTIAEVVELGGGPLAGEVTAVLCGGPSGGFLPPSELGRPLLPGPIHPTGAIMGAGGLIVLDSTSDVRGAALAMAAYNADESCGKCTPCREGTPR
ncbi:MAG: SLBB domain-containing protein, partial [Acidimicrobiales bacterium]